MTKPQSEADKIAAKVARASRGDPVEDLPNKAPKLDWKIKALRMRAQGYSYSAIGRAIGRSSATIKAWVEAELYAHVSPVVDEMRRLETVRLESLLTCVQGRIELGDDKAINAAVRISEQIAKLWGLYMPIKVDANVYQQTEQDRELAEIISEAKAQAAVDEARVIQAATEDPDL